MNFERTLFDQSTYPGESQSIPSILTYFKPLHHFLKRKVPPKNNQKDFEPTSKKNFLLPILLVGLMYPVYNNDVKNICWIYHEKIIK